MYVCMYVCMYDDYTIAGCEHVLEYIYRYIYVSEQMT
jgi:hypothetical protein